MLIENLILFVKRIQDDYYMMDQVIRRRFNYQVDGKNLPKLIVIDGGKGQLNIVEKATTRKN